MEETMHLSIVNCPDKDFKCYVKDAILFFCDHLIEDVRIRNNCKIKILFNDKLKDFGASSVVKRNTKNQPRAFLIEVHPGIGVRNIFDTLAHEMVHVKQYIKGEINDSLSVWKGKEIDSDDVDYWDHPWEIEAHGKEKGLVTKFAIEQTLWEVFDGYENPMLPIKPKKISWKK